MCLFFTVASISETASGLGIAVCGSNVRVTSVVLHADVSQPADIERNLLRLSASGVAPSRKSVGLMFACMGRGRRFYNGTAGVESAIFKRLYPCVPLFGFFGNGEIGYDFPVATNNKCCNDGTGAGDGSDGDDSSIPQMYHSFTTVFVLLSFL